MNKALNVVLYGMLLILLTGCGSGGDSDGNGIDTTSTTSTSSTTTSITSTTTTISTTSSTVTSSSSTSTTVTSTSSTTTTTLLTTHTISGTLSGAVVSGVTITLTGTGSSSATTDGSGNYSFTGAHNGSYTITPSRTGYRFSPASRSITVNNANVTGQNFTATAVYNISGTVSGAVASGVIVTLTGTGSSSATTDGSGNYIFSGAANGDYTLTPSRTGYTFSPANRSITVNNADMTGQNFTSSAVPSPAKAITSYFLGSFAGTINESAKTISVEVPYPTDVTALVATFTTTGSSVKVGSTVQTSGATANDFTSPVTYTVTAADASTQNYTVTVTSGYTGYTAEDILGNNTFGNTIEIDFSANTAKLSPGGTLLTITTDGVLPLTNVTVAQTTYGITITSTVSEKIIYKLSGVLSGTLTVNSSSAYQLYLNGVTINPTAGPALDLESSQKVYIVSASGTTNTLTDSSTRSLTMKASLYGKGPMIFSGNGTLSVTGSYKHAIFSNDYIRMREGTLNVAVSTKDAVRSVNGFIMDNGNLAINATGTTTDDESKGIKIEGVEGTGAGKGYIIINGGYITITSAGKAITAGWDIDEDATTSETSDDPNPYVIVNNGVINITTTVVPYETSTASCSPEGIEAKKALTVNNGYIIINATDDGFNAITSITLNGGYIYIKSTYADGLDSNGGMAVNGGFIVAIGQSGVMESSFDSQSSFSITGGTFVGIAANVHQPSSVTQNTVVLGSLTAGNTMALRANDGTIAFAYYIPQAYQTMILSSPDIASGTTYTVYTGGTASGDVVFHGLYLGGLVYAGGTAGSSFTVSSNVTKIGGSYF